MEEKLVMRTCPGCGQDVKYRAINALRGETTYIHLREHHKAKCGLPCCNSRDVTMQMVMQGRAHHPTRCECLKEGKGYA